MRRDAFSRELMREHRLSAGNFILPVFVIDGQDLVQDIPSMPGVQRMTIDRLLGVAEECVALGVPALALFPAIEPSLKTPDGAEALAKLRSGSYGLVISDWNMAPMTGLQLLQEVRADAKLKATPFIMITAESKTENVVAAKQAGVSNYIVKPFNAETLREKIEKVLGHA